MVSRMCTYGILRRSGDKTNLSLDTRYVLWLNRYQIVESSTLLFVLYEIDRFKSIKKWRGRVFFDMYEIEEKHETTHCT
jgi:hypothetical protein